MYRILLVAPGPFTDLAPALLEAGLCATPADLSVQPSTDIPEALPDWEPTVVLAPFCAAQQQVPLRDRFPEAAHVALCTDAAAATAALQAGADDALTPDERCPAVLRRAIPLAVARRKQASEPDADLHYRLFNDSPNPMWLYDRASLRFLRVNRTAEHVYGYSQQEFLNHLTVLDIRPAGERDRFLTMLPTGFTKGDYYFGTWQHQRRDGSLFFVKIYSQDTCYQGRNCRMVLAVDIDEQHRAATENTHLNEQIARQNERVEAVLNSLRDMVWSVDMQTGAFRYVNRACEAILGDAPETLVQNKQRVVDFIHPEDRRRLPQDLRTLFKHGALQRDYRIVARDGAVKHLSSHLSLVRDADGTPLAVTGVDSDVTAQYQAAMAHQRTTEELHTILESITDGFITLDSNWNFTYVNREFERVCGMPRHAVLGRNYWDVFPKANALKFYTEYHRAVRNRQSVHFEEYASSFHAWVSVSAYPTETGLTIYFQDVTAEKMLRDRIRRDEENVKALIDNTDNLIWSVDLDLCLVSSNQAFRQLFATQAGHPIEAGDPLISRGFGPETQEQWHTCYSRALAGETFEIVDMITRPDGTLQCNEIRFRPVFDSSGAITGICCFGRDVTEQRKRQVAIEMQNKRLRQIAWVQNHEVRGPLASILGSVSVLSLTPPAEADTYETLLDGLRDAAERLDAVVRNIDRMTRTVEPL